MFCDVDYYYFFYFMNLHINTKVVNSLSCNVTVRVRIDLKRAVGYQFPTVTYLRVHGRTPAGSRHSLVRGENPFRCTKPKGAFLWKHQVQG